MITPDNYLNIVSIIVNEIIGGVFLTLLIGWVIIAYACVVNNISPKVMLGIDVFFALFFLSLYYNQLILSLVLLVVGIVVALRWGKTFQ